MAQTEKQRIGALGETEACKYLIKLGFSVLTRNYLKPWGEIDIVAKKRNQVHFVEVKTVVREGNVIRETLDVYEPEDNIHPWKLKRLTRAISSYLEDKNIDEDVTPWQLDAIAVYVERGSDKVLKVEYLEDIL